MSLAILLLQLLNIYSFILFARAIYSWIDPTMQSSIGQMLLQLTEPVVAPIRQVVPPAGGIDWSIMVALFMLIILRQMVTQLL